MTFTASQCSQGKVELSRAIVFPVTWHKPTNNQRVAANHDGSLNFNGRIYYKQNSKLRIFEKSLSKMIEIKQISLTLDVNM